MMEFNDKQYSFNPLGELNARFDKELKAAVSKVLDSGRYINGEHVKALEKAISELCETRYCVAVSNGLDALRLILRAWIELGMLKPGDEVIVPANTYIASVLAVSDCGLKPVWVDADLTTLNLDTSQIERAVTARAKAVMPVHLYGTPCNDDTLLDVARKHHLLIIEDNAQAIGATSARPGLHGTSRAGGLGDAAGISFYPTKNLGALGDAGAVTTNNEQLAHVVRAIANYGSDTRYHNIYRGLNCRMDEIQAAMLLVKLKHLDHDNALRGEVAKAYDESICTPHVLKPTIFGNMRQVWHQYVILCDERDTLRKRLADRGIPTDVHYAVPPYLQPCYRAEFGDIEMPVTERIAAQAVSLPIAAITPDDARHIAEVINSCFP